jgi:hypothetical protein
VRSPSKTRLFMLSLAGRSHQVKDNESDSCGRLSCIKKNREVINVRIPGSGEETARWPVGTAAHRTC